MKEFKKTFYYRNLCVEMQREFFRWVWHTGIIICGGFIAGGNLITMIIYLITLGFYLIFTIKKIFIIEERHIVKKRYKENNFLIAPKAFFRVQDEGGIMAIYVDTEFGTKNIASKLIDPSIDYQEVSYYATKHRLVIIDIN